MAFRKQNYISKQNFVRSNGNNYKLPMGKDIILRCSLHILTESFMTAVENYERHHPRNTKLS